MACEHCWNLKHYKCHDEECTCSVCAATRKVVAKVVKKKPAKAKKALVAPKAAKAKRPPRPKRNPNAPRREPGREPKALTIEERREVHGLWTMGVTPARIVDCTGFTKSRVRAEVNRCKRGRLPVEA